MTAPLSIDRLREVLTYQPETGQLLWKKGHARARQGAVAGCPHGNGYVQVMVDKRRLFAHRVAWALATGAWPSKSIDHANGDRSDNRLCNLREATHVENGGNQRRRDNNTSGFKGVSFYKRRRKWRAYITAEKVHHHLGYFQSATEAHEAYLCAATRLFGEFAFGG